MTALSHPALPELLAEAGDDFVIAQVRLRRLADGHELRHLSDCDADPRLLRVLPIADLRALAQHSAAGKFRPLRAAPTLRSGWRVHVRSLAELEQALNHLYPGGVADWAAARNPAPPVTHYREFSQRQTGRYAVVRELSDPEAAAVARACCAPQRCLKRRLWTVDVLPPDSVSEKSLLPCLEPCAILLDRARDAATQDDS